MPIIGVIYYGVDSGVPLSSLTGRLRIAEQYVAKLASIQKETSALVIPVTQTNRASMLSSRDQHRARELGPSGTSGSLAIELERR